MTMPTAARVISSAKDRVAQWMVVLVLVAVVGVTLALITRVIEHRSAEAWWLVVMLLLFCLQLAVWRAAVFADLLVDDDALARSGVKRLPNAGSSWRLPWSAIAAASVVDGRRGPMLLVRPTLNAPIHASRWFQGIDPQLTRGSVLCPLDPQATAGVVEELHRRGIPALRG